MKRLLKEYNGVRLIVKLIPDPDVGYFVIENYIYRVQIRKRFLGIPYWKTLVKTTEYKIAKEAYDLAVNDDKKDFDFYCK